MSHNFIPFASPEIGNEEVAEVIATLESGWLTTGKKTEQFESSFIEFLGGGIEAIAVNSATAGLHLGLEALGIGSGDQVITTTHTFTATAEIIRYLGADPVFVDIDESNLCIDVDQVETSITSATKAILPVHFAGLSADIDLLVQIARKYNLHIVEDAAHALPTTHNGELVGKLDTDLTVFSFYANKTITTGEGGMLVTRNPNIAKRARLMRLHGINRDAFDRYTSSVPSWYYEIVAPGFKYNMTDLAASVGIHQLKKAHKFQQKRAEIANIYNEELSNLPLILPPASKTGDVHSWHLYVVQIKEETRIHRDSFIEKMFKKGIGCSVHYIPLHLQPYWRDTYKLEPNMYPVSQKVYERSVSLPIYSKMTIEDALYVVSCIKEIIQ
jgi:dTDP-4-amino-4,6-dideoxygalactose transaminase